MSAGHTIRPFRSIEEYQACVELQEETWGEGFSERVAPAILKVSQILGGVAAGAYGADGSLDGFVFGMTGLRDGEIVHWSDMLAVRPAARDAGLGRRLKAYQRDRVMELGVRRMFWTFDPLQSRNAYLNFRKLGVVVREYVEDMYGQTDSPLHRGIGTDRFIACWELDSQRVRVRLEDPGGTAVAGAAGTARGDDGARPEAVDSLDDVPRVLTARLAPGHPRPADVVLDAGNDVVAVEIPTDVGCIMEDDMELARAWRAASRSVFTHYLAEGFEVRDFHRGEDVSTYRVVRHAS